MSSTEQESGAVQHTPGPWQYHEGFSATDYHITAAANSEADRGQPLWCNDPGSAYGDEPGEAHANARLIAAAPDLLEALKAAMDYIDHSPCDPDITPAQWAAYKRLQETDAAGAIAKAEGRAEG